MNLDHRYAEPVIGSLERFGLTRLAVIAYVLAYVKSKHGNGWQAFGGKEHQEPLQAAVVLDAKLAFSELGMAIVDVLHDKYYGAQGISQALFQIFCNPIIGAAPYKKW